MYTSWSIPVYTGAKIIALVDTYDRIEKMNESGSLKNGEGEEQNSEETGAKTSAASAYIRDQAGKRFDPDVVKVFLEEILKEEV